MPNETIGYCQGCGVVDHHLIHELCDSCTEKVVTLPVVEAVPLGVEAADVDCIPAYMEVCYGA